jgi:hypothetical protein
MEPWDEKRNPSLVERAIAKATARWTRLRALTGAQPAPAAAVPAIAPPAPPPSAAAKRANGSRAHVRERPRKAAAGSPRARRVSGTTRTAAK